MVTRRPAPRRKPTGRPKAIVNLQGTPRPVYRNWMVYADPGVGKTVFAGTAPKGLILSYDVEGTESARAMGSNCDEWPIDTWADAVEAYDYFAEGTGCQDYDWVIPDNLSTLEEHIWAFTLGEGKKRNKKRPDFKRALGDYPVVWDTLKRHVGDWNRLPVNVLYTANTMRIDTNDPETEEEHSKLMPLLGSPKRGDTSARICASLSLVGLLRTVKKADGSRGRRLHVEETDFWVAKTRYPAMVPYINAPSVEAMAKIALTGARPKPAKRSSKAIKKENS